MDDIAAGASTKDDQRRIPATLMAGLDGEIWITVDGADVRQLAERIGEVCDVLIPEQQRRQ
ncbi:hypothetical protein [Saccharothrix saharensis]|uniref:hypothetical protein n=1 Tax=Saccharothrix saharensis TaxID=571190 RepID=UPI00114D9493|nr:hypothetical protein [Saccharothrix saharensis]